MIDLETKIFNSIATKLRSAYSGIFVSGEYTPTPSKFPCVTIEQAENAVVNGYRSSSGIENLVRVMFEVNVYSNKDNGKKQEAKDIMACASDGFSQIGFTRTFCQPLPNLQDSTIYRYTARFEAAIGEGDSSANSFIIYNI